MMSNPTRVVFGGVDTHKDEHVAAVIDAARRLVDVAAFDTSPAGYAELRSWMAGFGELVAVGVEGCGSHGLGLVRELTTAGVKVHEVCRPNR